MKQDLFNTQKKKTGFVLTLILLLTCSNACARPQADVSKQIKDTCIYRGLLSMADSQDISIAVSYFESALSHPNVFKRRAAAEELANIIYGSDLPPEIQIQEGTRRQIREEAAGMWGQAFALTANPNKNETLDFLLNLRGTTFTDEVWFFILREMENKGVVFSETELIAINGHFNSVRTHHSEAMGFFRRFQVNGRWPAHAPHIFLQYPSLINDLGLTFISAGTRTEGMDLFLQWENNLERGSNEIARYNLLFYAARVARQRGRNDQAVSLFNRARLIAPNDTQRDACIWYILDYTAGQSAEDFIRWLGVLTPHLYRHNSIDTILERFYQRSIADKEWRQLIQVFNIIKNHNMAYKAGYAWAVGRLIEERLLSAADLRLASQAIDAPATPSAFFNIAYDAGENYARMSLFYRMQSAASLGLPFLTLRDADNAGVVNNSSDAFVFLRGFFENDAAVLSPRFIWQLERELSEEEMRTLAEKLGSANMYAPSIRLISTLIGRPDYIRSRQDMEVLYPVTTHYNELIERNAAEYGFAPYVLFSLVRQESAFQSAVVSHAGAIGLAQLMPTTAADVARRILQAGGPDYAYPDGELDLTNPETNMHMGAFYLNSLMARFDNDLLLSRLSYNSGHTRVRRWRNASDLPWDLFNESLPILESRDYGRMMVAGTEIYRLLYFSED